MIRLPSLNRLTISTDSDEDMTTLRLQWKSKGGLRRSKQRSLCLSSSVDACSTGNTISSNDVACHSSDRSSDFGEWGHFVDMIEVE